MDPDLAITICFDLLVLLFALVFTFYVVREVHQAHAKSTTAQKHTNRQKGIR